MLGAVLAGDAEVDDAVDGDHAEVGARALIVGTVYLPVISNVLPMLVSSSLATR